MISMFWGFYPSFFSENAATNTYWTQPALYNPARPLFRKYIPLIKNLNTLGWQPFTGAITSAPANVSLERFGQWPNMKLTVRNTKTSQSTATVMLIKNLLGIPQGVSVQMRLQLAGTVVSMQQNSTYLFAAVTLAGSTVDILSFTQTTGTSSSTSARLSSATSASPAVPDLATGSPVTTGDLSASASSVTDAATTATLSCNGVDCSNQPNSHCVGGTCVCNDNAQLVNGMCEVVTETSDATRILFNCAILLAALLQV